MCIPVFFGDGDDGQEHQGHDREGDQCFANEVSEGPHVKEYKPREAKVALLKEAKSFWSRSPELLDEMHGDVDEDRGGNNGKQEPHEEGEENGEPTTSAFVRKASHVVYLLSRT